MKRTKTKKQIAAAFGVHRRTIEAWQELGLPADKRNGAYYFDIGEVRAWMEANGRTGDVGRPPEENALSAFGVEAGQGGGMKDKLAKAELARRIALAKIYNLRYEQERGKLVPRSEVEAGNIARITSCKARLLSLPGRVAPLLVGRTVREIESDSKPCASSSPISRMRVGPTPGSRPRRWRGSWTFRSQRS
jgi:hypothetical protein